MIGLPEPLRKECAPEVRGHSKIEDKGKITIDFLRQMVAFRARSVREAVNLMYNSYFGFPESPFNVTPDPRFFYTNPVYQEAFAALRYGIEAKKGFIVITGEVGTGKTTLLRKLMRNLGDTIHSVFIFNTLLSFPELLQLILHDLSLAPKEPSKVAMHQELNDYLIKQLKQGHVVSVLIDEAQNLSDEALEGLRLLSNLETDQEKLLQIVLMGQPELKTKLDRPGLRQLKQRVAFQCRLAPLKDEEVGRYIDFRLRTVGYAGKDLFQPDAVQQIAFYSRGIPRLINIICDNALLIAYAGSQKIISADIIKEVGRDLRLGSEVQVTDAETIPTLSESNTARDTSVHEVPNGVLRRKVERRVGVGVGTLLIILAFVAVASVIDPQHFFSTAADRLEVSKHNLKQWVALVTHQQAVPQKITAEATARQQAASEKTNAEAERVVMTHPRVIIQHGSTIHKIASQVYGANTLLGMDLIKEFNPQIENLNWVFPGQDLLLPPLTHETMLRKQPDGSYRLIVASFPSLTEANKSARLLGYTGYQVVITPKRVSDDLLLHRIEIDGLKNSEDAKQIWETGLRNQWFAFVDNPTSGTR
ncbi:MAG: AAA family ATPase [Candidatus Binatia bacterium]